MGQQLCVNIDSEIRSLICLLNDTPYIQTHSCCSGHPNEPSQGWSHGFITMVPIVDFCSFFQFLDELQPKLNRPAERPFELFQQVNGEALFSSTAPLLNVYCNFTLGASQRTNIGVYNLLLSVVQEFLGEGEHISVKTAEEGADILTDKLYSTPHVQLNKTKFLGGRRVVCEAIWRYDSCKWCWDLVEYVNKRFEEAWAQYDWFHALYSGRTEELRAWKRDNMLSGEKNDCDELRNRFQRLIDYSHLFAHAFFVIQPVIKSRDVNRTREEHLQIWRLTELVTESLIGRLPNEQEATCHNHNTSGKPAEELPLSRHEELKALMDKERFRKRFNHREHGEHRESQSFLPPLCAPLWAKKWG